MSSREFFMRSHPQYVQCEVVVEQDQKVADHHRTMVAKTPEGRVFMACLGMGTWCEADYTDYARWFRLVGENVDKIRHCHRMELIEHFKWSFFHTDDGWNLLDSKRKMVPVVGWHKTYMNAFNLTLRFAMDDLDAKVMHSGVTDFPPVLLQVMVNQIRWRNQHNPVIRDPLWMTQL